ncbi:hypothetical protein C6A85_000000101725, partial [Mycobacterium sp. ITM-2017-0098]
MGGSVSETSANSDDVSSVKDAADGSQTSDDATPEGTPDFEGADDAEGEDAGAAELEDEIEVVDTDEADRSEEADDLPGLGVEDFTRDTDLDAAPAVNEDRSGPRLQPTTRDEAQSAPKVPTSGRSAAPDLVSVPAEVVIHTAPAAPLIVDAPAVQPVSNSQPSADSSTEAVDVGTVLSALLSPFDSSDGDVPVDPPLVWTLLAFARRQFGQQQRALIGDPLLPVAALDDNNAPTGRVSVGTPGWFTAKVTGRVIGSDPDRDPLTYFGSTSTAKGVVVVNAQGRFTYTPTDEARHAAAKTGATEADKTDSFVVTIDDGNGGVTPVTVQ